MFNNPNSFVNDPARTFRRHYSWWTFLETRQTSGTKKVVTQIMGNLPASQLTSLLSAGLDYAGLYLIKDRTEDTDIWGIIYCLGTRRDSL